MSWLFGIIRKNNFHFPKFNLDEEFQKVERQNLFLAVSKNINSFLNSSDPDIIQACVGIPIQNKNGKKEIVNSLDDFLFNHEEVSGHFVHVRYQNSILQIKNDEFGLRELFYIDDDEKFVFSTRYDLLFPFVNRLSINPAVFSSLWLSDFQLSTNSIIKEVSRLGQAGKITCTAGDVKVLKMTNNLSYNCNDVETFFTKLKEYTHISFDESKELSLALSGGIDSRLLISILLEGKNKFKCHTISNEDINDLKIAKEICNSQNLNLEIIFREEKSMKDISEKIKKYYTNISPVIPVSQLMDFIFYGRDYYADKIIIDGSFGEFFRGQYFKKLFLNGPKIFEKENLLKLKQNLHAPKSPIFNPDFNRELYEYYDQAILKFTTEKLDKNKNEYAEFLDKFGLKYKLPCIGGSGQIILDQDQTAIMPMVQKEVIHLGLNIDYKIKSDSKLFKRIIKKNKDLYKIGLVKSNVESKLFINDKILMAKILLDRKFNKSQNYERYNSIQNSKEFVMDILISKKVTENNYLNSKQNIKIAEAYYTGDQTKSVHMDWLLTFIFWSTSNKIS